MKPEYQDWVCACGYDDPRYSLAKCVEATEHMQRVFPVLKIKKGVVYSTGNPDNCSDQYPKQYPHQWLEDEYGNIVDPTASQFWLLPNLQYKEVGCSARKCMGCGQYFESEYDGFCGECPWSE